MSYLVAAPDEFAAAAAGLDRIGSAIDAAGSSAMGPTTAVLSAAGDEVSTAIAKLFGSFGAEYQAAIARAVAFQARFGQALATAGSAYAEAETSVQSLLGAIGTGGSMLTANTAAQQVALIMGGTSNPLPDLNYLIAIDQSYIQRLFAGAMSLLPLTTPEQFWPVTPQLGNLTFDQSVAQGVTLLNNAINYEIGTSHNVVVFGYSQSATIATNEIMALMAAGSPNASNLSFVLVGDPNNPNGGLLTRFPGFYIPFLDVAFNGATPPNSPYPTSIYTAQYDGIADAPQYPLNVLADINAFMGYFYVHNTYPLLTATQVSNAVPLPTSPGYTGNTQYYMLMTQDLPLVQPIRDIPYAGPVIADIIQPDLRVLVDLGYSSYGPGLSYANVPTPAGLFSIPNPSAVIYDLALGAVQGPYAAVLDIPVEAGVLSPTSPLFPNTYPYVPSIDPGTNMFLGQPQTTLLSQLSGDLGNILSIIPSIYY